MSKQAIFSKEDEIGAILRIFPVLEEVIREIKIDKQRINCVIVESAGGVVNEGTTCANGFNYTGWIYTIKDEKIYKKATWEEIRQQREDFKLPEPYINSAQTFLDGSEEACIFVQEHERAGSARFSIHIFNCPGRYSFSSYQEIRAWIKEPDVRREIQKVI